MRKHGIGAKAIMVLLPDVWARLCWTCVRHYVASLESVQDLVHFLVELLVGRYDGCFRGTHGFVCLDKRLNVGRTHGSVRECDGGRVVPGTSLRTPCRDDDGPQSSPEGRLSCKCQPASAILDEVDGSWNVSLGQHWMTWSSAELVATQLMARLAAISRLEYHCAEGVLCTGIADLFATNGSTHSNPILDVTICKDTLMIETRIPTTMVRSSIEVP